MIFGKRISTRVKACAMASVRRCTVFISPEVRRTPRLQPQSVRRFDASCVARLDQQRYARGATASLGSKDFWGSLQLFDMSLPTPTLLGAMEAPHTREASDSVEALIEGACLREDRVTGAVSVHSNGLREDSRPLSHTSTPRLTSLRPIATPEIRQETRSYENGTKAGNGAFVMSQIGSRLS